MKKLLFALAGAALFSFGAHAADVPLKVVASFSIIADMAKNVGGDAVIVTSLVGPDEDAHGYQPSPEDIKALAKADVIFINGLGFEGWMERLIESSGTKGAVVTVSEGVHWRTMTKDGKPLPDPHAWQDLSRGRVYVENIAAALEKALPDKAPLIRQRAARYEAELVETDLFVRKELSAFPKEQRVVMTSHDAFGYFGDAYDVTFLSPSGVGAESEAAAFDVAKLIKQLRANGIKLVFIENMTNPKLIEQIGKDAGAKIGGTLYADALSSGEGPTSSYLSMFRHNVALFKKSFQSMQLKK